MDKLNQAFLDILKAALRGEKITKMELTPEEWGQVLKLAEQHTVLPMIYQAVYELPELKNGSIPEVTLAKRQVIRQVSMQTVKTEEFLSLYRKLTEAGVRPLVVKGLICRELYPVPDYRPSGDEDILIQPEQFELCHQVMTAFGMHSEEPEEQHENAYEVPYRKQNGLLHIELHKYLFPPQSEAYGYWSDLFQGVHRHARAQEVMGTTVYSLSHTKHLFYLICHAFKHFLHSGVGIRQVCDIVMYANRYGHEIKWAQVMENCLRIRAEKFAAAIFEIGRKYLVFDPEQAGYPAQWRRVSVDEKPMLADILAGGIYGASTMSRKHSSNMTLDAVVASNQGKKAEASLWGSLFPTPRKLEKRYPYLKKHPWMAPVAWTSRLLQYGKETRKDRGQNNAAEAIRVGSQRVELLRIYDVIE